MGVYAGSGSCCQPIPRCKVLERGDPKILAVHWMCRVVGGLGTLSGGLERFASGVASIALTPSDMRKVTGRAYDHMWSWSQAPYDHDEEESWLSEALPAPPARILVGACGTGREVCALLRKGYEVWAFEPSQHALSECKEHNPSVAFAGCFAYEELVEESSHGTRGCALLPAGTRFDAILLGWGSLSHVTDEQTQLGLLNTLHGLAPGGPILASGAQRRP